MSEFAPSSSPSSTATTERPRYDDGDIDLIMDEEAQNATPDAASVENPDIPEGPGAAYPEDGEAWKMPEAYKEEDQWEPRSLEELNTHEDLEGSEGLKQRVREVAFDRMSQVHQAKAQYEDVRDGFKQKYLEQKQQRQKAKYENFERKGFASLTQRGRERNQMKAKWAKRRLNATSAKLYDLEKRHNPVVAETKDGKTVSPSRIDTLRIKQAVERRRELERRRNVLIEKKLVANQEKRLRGEQPEGVAVNLTTAGRNRLTDITLESDSMGEFREGLKSLLRDELNRRVEAYEKQVRKPYEQKLQSQGDA